MHPNTLAYLRALDALGGEAAPAQVRAVLGRGTASASCQLRKLRASGMIAGTRRTLRLTAAGAAALEVEYPGGRLRAPVAALEAARGMRPALRPDPPPEASGRGAGKRPDDEAPSSWAPVAGILSGLAAPADRKPKDAPTRARAPRAPRAPRAASRATPRPPAPASRPVRAPSPTPQAGRDAIIARAVAELAALRAERERLVRLAPPVGVWTAAAASAGRRLLGERVKLPGGPVPIAILDRYGVASPLDPGGWRWKPEEFSGPWSSACDELVRLALAAVDRASTELHGLIAAAPALAAAPWS